MTRNKIIACGVALIAIVAIVTSCSSTSALPEGEQLFTGLKPIEYTNYEACQHAEDTKIEMESVLASAPNGSLFGSSYYRSPFQFKLWIWNAFSQSKSPLSQWISRTFGSKPKLLSEVNPALRVSVAENHLKMYGYFNNHVTSREITGSNPKKAKIAYTVNMGHLWRYDSIQYIGFPSHADSLLQASSQQALINRETPLAYHRSTRNASA